MTIMRMNPNSIHKRAIDGSIDKEELFCQCTEI
jgi:hypothetical protein